MKKNNTGKVVQPIKKNILGKTEISYWNLATATFFSALRNPAGTLARKQSPSIHPALEVVNPQLL